LVEVLRPSGGQGDRHRLAPEAVMIRVTITLQAFEAIRASLPPKTPIERSVNGVFVWLDKLTLNQLIALRRRSEDLSDTIIRMAGMSA
jgi:hypothetical protein